MAGTLFKRGEDDEHAADVGDVRAGEDRVTGDADGVAHALGLSSHIRHAGDHFVAALQTGAVRKLGVHDQISLVLFRDEARGDCPEPKNCESDEAAIDQKDNDAYTEKQGYSKAIEARRAVEDPVKTAEEGAKAGVGQGGQEP